MQLSGTTAGTPRPVRHVMQPQVQIKSTKFVILHLVGPRTFGEFHTLEAMHLLIFSIPLAKSSVLCSRCLAKTDFRMLSPSKPQMELNVYIFERL